MRADNSKLMKIFLIIYFSVLTLFICRIVFFTDLKDFINARKEAVERDYSTDWILDSGETVDLKDISAGGLGGSFCVSKKLPDEMLETDSVYLSTSNLHFNVYVDDDLIYSYDTHKNLTGMGDGVSYHMIGLGIKDEGRTMRIEADTVFLNKRGGRINEMQFGAEEQFRYYMMSENFVASALSALMVIFGVVVIVFFFAVFRKTPMMRSLWALGLTAILFGVWSLCDVGMPQLIAGSIYACREIIYGIPHLAVFPMIYFINYVTRARRKIYPYLSFAISVACFGWLLFSRYVFGRDLHTMTFTIYFSYISGLIILIVLLIDNELYCRKKKISSGLKHFYLGAVVFVITSVGDIIRYTIGKKVSIGRGSWFRFGLVTFFLFMGLQIIDWWTKEKTSLERDRFVNRLLQYIMDSADPEAKINKVLEYLCEELHADRAYIFEDMNDGTFDNTYEYCAEGVTPEIDNLKGLPYDGTIDVWYEEYAKGGHVLIYDLEKYRNVSESMYEVLKPQGIQTLVTGPLILEGDYIGFFGVDNPPADMMMEISEIIRLLMFFLSSLVARRDNQRRLMELSYQDALTGVGNRRAIKEFEKEGLDTSCPYGFVMCDINGLKAVNDNAGHDAGDELIKEVASCLTEVFGQENVYRMGGDEFAVYVDDENLQAFESRIYGFKSLIAKKGYHVAVGYSYAKDGDPDYNSLKIEADNRMYDEKREYYSSGHDRRKAQAE
ncbi:MAG: sensor domain-containing diguanylate cyclase [Lachnospiraceae bacterium]|nr:sensor domain-containing diguanylate cyclase [Lachnospiraceae bacterium]